MQTTNPNSTLHTASIVEARRQEAWQLARKAAALLRERYHAQRVVAFGSLANGQIFNAWSDVDIAAWGIAPENTFKAIADVLWLSTEIQVNLVDVNTCSDNLLRRIEHDGVDV
jgi:predicted nucleotidyltransferase